MLLETERNLCEDLERLEQAVADRYLEEPQSIRQRLTRDHQIARFIDRFEEQSKRLLEIRADKDGARRKEIESISHGDPFEEFYRQLNQVRDFHKRYPNEPVENLETAYKIRPTDSNGTKGGPANSLLFGTDNVDAMFTGEESNGRFLDLTINHSEYLNLPGIKRISYLQYLGQFDSFAEFRGKNARNDRYFKYLTGLAEYLESFLRRTKPLENPDKIMSDIETEFSKKWEAGEVEGWGKTAGPAKPSNELFCQACEKEFANANVFNAHLTGKKHKKNAERHKAADGGETGIGEEEAQKLALGKLKERAMAEREFRIRKLGELLSKEKEDTKVNVERKASLTDREREHELEMMNKDIQEGTAPPAEDDDDKDERVYNPLKLPLAWDGKPIPYWLYKLHGLGVELNCEICGNFVYMGRRAFDKHFNEWRHIHGLKCLGITNTTLFREITKIEDAEKLWAKIQTDKKQEKQQVENITEMEDDEGNVMSQKVYEDLKRQGLL